MINCDCMIMALITYDIPFEMYKHLKVILVMMILKGHGSSCSYYESPSFFDVFWASSSSSSGSMSSAFSSASSKRIGNEEFRRARVV